MGSAISGGREKWSEGPGTFALMWRLMVAKRRETKNTKEYRPFKGKNLAAHTEKSIPLVIEPVTLQALTDPMISPGRYFRGKDLVDWLKLDSLIHFGEQAGNRRKPRWLTEVRSSS